MRSKTLTVERVRELFNYDSESGEITRKVTVKSRGGLAGNVIRSMSSNGYYRASIDRGRYGAHRIAWIHFHGEIPAGDIDHIDGNRTNNSIKNLRHVDRSTNLENTRSAKSHNKSTGVLGAYFDKKRNKYSSRIQVKGNSFYLGTFATAQEAHDAYLSVKRVLHAGCTI